MAETATLTVVSAAPLLVRADGADTNNPAAIVTGVAVAAGDRVQATIRTPRPPLVTGVQA